MAEHKNVSVTMDTYQNKLRQAGLRLTKQRLALGQLLFDAGDRHVTAEGFYDEARRAGIEVSLATIYNTLHQFREAGLLRQVFVDSSKSYFDTNISEHHHFFSEDTGELVDIPSSGISVQGLPAAPEGTTIESIDVVVRLK